MGHRKRKGVFLILLAVLFMVIGIWRGEAQAVFQKSTRICLECIGIG